MFETYDNSGLIRINYHSSDAVADRINILARRANVPVVSSPLTMGGYRFPILEEMTGDGGFQILKSHLPGDSVPHFLELKAAIEDPNTMFSYVDGSNVTIVQGLQWQRGVDSISEFGWSALAGQKTFKRIKTLCRPFRTFDVRDEPLRVHIVSDDAYTELADVDEDLVELLLDGAFVVAPWIKKACLDNVSFPVAGVTSANYNVDDFRKKMFMTQARDTVAWNARIFGKMIFSGINHDDPLHDRPGMLKGEAFVHLSDICERMKVDVICARSALKSEVSCDGKTYILMEAQKPKFDAVMSDLQTMVTLPALYEPEQTKFATQEFLNRGFKALCDNQVLEYWYEMASPLFNRQTALYDMTDVATLTKWNARAWVMSGLQITTSPWLFEQLAGSVISVLKTHDPSKLRFPIMCAIRCQVISASFAGMCGDDTEVIPGQARYVPELEAVVVSDEDWLEMYRSHGGCDLDDFFVVYYRNIGGHRKLICVRSPNDMGEYSVFDYVEGDYFPTFATSDGTLIEFPEVSDDPALWSTRLSEAYEQGIVSYKGLPSENEDHSYHEGPYTMTDVFDAMENNRSSQACVGANVNSRILWNSTVRQHRGVQLTTMEGCIDAGAQGGSAADTEAVMAEAKEIVRQVVQDQDGLIDAYIWNSRFAGIHKYPFPMERLCSDGYITKNHEFRMEYGDLFMRRARKWAQANCVNKLDPIIHTLGLLYAKPAYRLLISSRVALVNSQRNAANAMEIDSWASVHAQVVSTLEKLESDVQRHDLMMALLSVCHRVPTSTSEKYSDQLVMNPDVFPYLMDAMRFYGLAAYVDVTEEGKIQRWWHNEWTLTCDNCAESVTTKNPLALQNYHYYNGVCKQCR